MTCFEGLAIVKGTNLETTKLWNRKNERIEKFYLKFIQGAHDSLSYGSSNNITESWVGGLV